MAEKNILIKRPSENMKKITIEITIKENVPVKPIDQQEDSLDKIVSMILDGYISGEVFLDPLDNENDFVSGWWTLKTE